MRARAFARGETTPSERAVVATAAAGILLAPLNTTMIVVSLASIAEDFDASIASASWLVTSYIIVLAVLAPVAGGLGDRYGRRRLIAPGLAVFGVASLVASLAPSLPFLITCRVAQAVSGAVVFPNCTGLLRAHVSAARRGRAFGTIGAVTAAAAAVGPGLGGALAGAFGWHAIFLVNVPLVLLALYLTLRFVPRDADRRPGHQFDWLGTLLFAVTLVGAAFLTLAGSSFSTPWLLVLAAVGIVAAGIAFVRTELGRPDPALELRLFRRRVFTAATSAMLASSIASYVMILATPLLLEREHGWSTAEVGVTLMLLSVPMAFLAPFGGRIADTYGRRAPALWGTALSTTAFVPFVGWPGLSPPVVCLALAATGVGLGFASAPMQTASIEACPSELAGAASGIYGTSRYIGGFVASLALSGLVGNAFDASGFRSVYALALVAAGIAALLTTMLPGPRGVLAPRSRQSPA